MTEYGTDWNNIDLNSPCQRDLNLIEGLTFEALLLEVHCNLPNITEDTVRKQFLEDLNSRVTEAKDIFDSNLKNIVKYANEYRKE